MSKRATKPTRPTERQGMPAIGRVAKILVGQGHGYIRVRGGREIYFHRGDLGAGTQFNDLRVGETVIFELLEDSVSGARALRVTRRAP